METHHSLTDYDDGGRDECADEEAEHEDADDDAEALDQVHVRDLDRLRRPHAENHRDSGRWERRIDITALPSAFWYW